MISVEASTKSRKKCKELIIEFIELLITIIAKPAKPWILAGWIDRKNKYIYSFGNTKTHQFRGYILYYKYILKE